MIEQEFLDLIKDDMARCALRYRAVVDNLNRKKVLPKRDCEILYSDVSALYTENSTFLTSDIASTRRDCSESYEHSLYIAVKENIKKCAISKVVVPLDKGTHLKPEMLQSCFVREHHGCSR